MQEAPSLYPEPYDIKEPPGRGKHGYARKKNAITGKPGEGWVVVCGTAPNLKNDYEYMGHRYLPQYGDFIPDTNLPRAKGKNQDSRGQQWNSATEPWRLIFQLGGAHEFPVDQIIAYHWHVKPPYREVTFPQLEGVEVTDYPCPECPAFFSSTNPAEAAANLRTHITAGINGRHSYTPKDLRELGQEWGIDFETSRVRRNIGPAITEVAVEEPTSEGEPDPVRMTRIENLRKAREAKKEKALAAT